MKNIFETGDGRIDITDEELSILNGEETDEKRNLIKKLRELIKNKK